MSTTTLARGLFVVALRSYTLLADEPFSVHCERYDGSEACMTNKEASMTSAGKYMFKFEVAGRVRLFVNDTLVREVPDAQDDEDEATQC